MANVASLHNVTVTIDGEEITGWSDDTDCLMQPQASVKYTKRTGALGHTTYFSNPAAIGGELVIKLLPTSSSVPGLQRRATAIDQGDTLILEGGYC